MYVFFLARASGHFYTMGNDNASVQPVLTLADKELVEQMISTFWILFKTETGGVLPARSLRRDRAGPCPRDGGTHAIRRRSLPYRAGAGDIEKGQVVHRFSFLLTSQFEVDPQAR